jgi:hypothetical protein
MCARGFKPHSMSLGSRTTQTNNQQTRKETERKKQEELKV